MQKDNAKESTFQRNEKQFAAGLLTGLISTTVFNPIDKAIYLHTTQGAPLFRLSTWKKPYQGIGQAIFNRTISYGIYYPLLDTYDTLFNKLPQREAKLMAGLLTGINTAVITAPVNLIKHYKWNIDLHNSANMQSHGLAGRQGNIQSQGLSSRQGNIRFSKIISIVYHKDGMTGLCRGLGLTIVRDSTFASIYHLGYSVLKDNIHNPAILFPATTALSCCCTVLTSPINYARSVKYYATWEKPNPNTYDIWNQLLKDTLEKPSSLDRLKYLIRTMAIGPGTIRVGLGVTTGQFLYDFFKKRLSNE